MRNLSIEWTKGLTPDRKEPVESLVRNSTAILTRVQEIAKGWEEEIRSAEIKLSEYDSPAWEAKQAHRNGDLSRIKKILDLLSFLNGDRNV